MKSAMDDSHAKRLRHQIALYRGHLAEGIDGDIAAHYLREITRITVELEQIEKKDGDNE